MNRLLPIAALSALLLCPVANAQNREVSFAPYLGHTLSEPKNAVVGVGVDADLFEIGPIGIGAWGDVETQFIEDVSNVQFNINLTPYYEIDKFEVAVGIGYAYERQSFEVSGDSSNTFTDDGINTILAVKYNAGFLNPYLRFRCTFFNDFLSDPRVDTLFGGVAIPILTY